MHSILSIVFHNLMDLSLPQVQPLPSQKERKRGGRGGSSPAHGFDFEALELESPDTKSCAKMFQVIPGHVAMLLHEDDCSTLHIQ